MLSVLLPCNASFGKVGRISSEEVVLQLVTSKFIYLCLYQF